MTAPLPKNVRADAVGSTQTDIGSPPVRQTRWPLVHGAAVFVVSLVIMYGIGLLVSYGRGLAPDPLSISDYDPVGRLIGAVVGASVALAGFFLVVARSENRPGDGWAGRGKIWEVVCGLAIGTAILASSVGLIALFGGYEVTGIHASPELLLPLASGIGAGITEEVLFRGVAQRLLDEWAGSWAALAIVSVFFGFMHIANPGIGVWGAVGITIQAGILLGAAFLATRRIWLGIGIHIAWNTLQSGLFSYSADADPTRQGILAATVDGPVWLTGGSAELQGSLVSTGICVLVAALLLVVAWRRGHIRPGPRRGQPEVEEPAQTTIIPS